ncbi:hypothetical protein ABG79_00923 [Caloramator mitchellensis]|uniref:Uncharacterized protein n=1 Tax=Caloramator mitchellensis TaxID=908809 RepID=A0A0R3K2C6_CALMK|nr:hypothetical protein [Caloramator mitchellensis]KRQ87125.1 hypothetical protein ABG79_00923 [Caloramator mitchellensis]
MSRFKGLFRDIIISMAIGAGISLVLVSISWVICLFLYRGEINSTLFFIKNALYYVGIFTLFLSAAFFMQRNATRPLEYEDEWKEHFKVLNLGLVILFIAIAITTTGMLLHFIIERRGGLI